MGRPEPIRAILPSILAQWEGLSRNPIEKTWGELLGRQKAGKTRIESCRNGQLLVSVESASLLHDLALRKATLLGQLEKALGKGAVQDIQLRIGKV